MVITFHVISGGGVTTSSQWLPQNQPPQLPQSMLPSMPLAMGGIVRMILKKCEVYHQKYIAKWVIASTPNRQHNGLNTPIASIIPNLQKWFFSMSPSAPSTSDCHDLRTLAHRRRSAPHLRHLVSQAPQFWLQLCSLVESFAGWQDKALSAPKVLTPASEARVATAWPQLVDRMRWHLILLLKFSYLIIDQSW